MRGTAIVDIDGTTPDHPHHPSTVVLIDANDEMTPVSVPACALADKLPLLCAARPTESGGKVEKSKGTRTTSQRDFGCWHAATSGPASLQTTLECNAAVSCAALPYCRRPRQQWEVVLVMLGYKVRC